MKDLLSFIVVAAFLAGLFTLTKVLHSSFTPRNDREFDSFVEQLYREASDESPTR